MESEFFDRIPWEKQYYSDIIFPHFPKSIKCRRCGTTFLDERTQISYHILHLKEVHEITELSEHPEREFLQQNFSINEVDSVAKCVTCFEVINYNKYGLYLLQNHLELYHEINSNIYKLITRTKSGRDILEKYFIRGIEATCPTCDLKIDMTHANTHPAEKAEDLFEHYFSHRLIPTVNDYNRITNFVDEAIREIREKRRKRLNYLRSKRRLRLSDKEELLRMERPLNEISASGRTVLNEPGPSTSSSMADDRTDRSEQSEVKNIPTKRSKSSTLDKTQLKQKKKNKRQFQ